jgi:hypothetical protein
MNFMPLHHLFDPAVLDLELFLSTAGPDAEKKSGD